MPLIDTHGEFFEIYPATSFQIIQGLHKLLLGDDALTGASPAHFFQGEIGSSIVRLRAKSLHRRGTRPYTRSEILQESSGIPAGMPEEASRCRPPGRRRPQGCPDALGSPEAACIARISREAP